MPKINSLPTETMQKISELLLNGARNQDVAKAADITINKVGYFRKKMVDAGILPRQRNRRTARNKSVTRTKTVSTFTPIQEVAQAHDISPVSGTRNFIFRINGMEVQVNDAKRVNVLNGVIEIKY